VQIKNSPPYLSFQNAVPKTFTITSLSVFFNHWVSLLRNILNVQCKLINENNVWGVYPTFVHVDAYQKNARNSWKSIDIIYIHNDISLARDGLQSVHRCILNFWYRTNIFKFKYWNSPLIKYCFSLFSKKQCVFYND